MMLLLALASAGCSSSQRSYQPSWSGAEPEHRVASGERRRVEMEDDGVEAQVPPPPSIRLAPDDPSEPWSRNYGARPGASQPQPASKPVPPQPPPVGRSKVASTDQD
jgi:ferric-dicitrate binding protein FerR (iron transport regulator)